MIKRILTCFAVVAWVLPHAAFTRDLRLQIFDGATPVPNAKITGTLFTSKPQTTSSDAQGIATITLPDQEPTSLRLMVTADRFLSHELWWMEYRITRIPSFCTVHLQKGIRAGGTVTTTDARPISGAKVRIYGRHFLGDDNPANPYTWPREWDITPEDPVTTDSAGHWQTLVPTAISDNRAWLSIQHDDYLFAERLVKPGVEMDQLHAGSLPLTMTPAAHISGIVESPDKKPIANARIALTHPGRDDGQTPECKSDASGHYHLGGVSPGPAKLMVIADAMAPQLVDVNPTLEKETTTDIHLQTGSTLTGKVVDHDGNPIPNAYVSASSYQGVFVWDIWNTTTGSDGTFSWNGAPPDAISLQTTAPGFQQRDNITAHPGVSLSILLHSTSHLHLTILDQSTSQPIPNVIAYQGITYQSKQINWTDEKTAGDPDGILDAYIFEHDPHYFRVTALNHLPEVIGPYDDKSGEVSDTVSLQPVTPVQAAVKLPSGQPAKNATVALVLSEEYVRLINDNRTIIGGEVTHTDDAGNFLIPPHTDKASLLILADEGFAWLPDDAPSPITLTPWATIRGELHQEHSPLASAHAILRWKAKEKYVSGTPRFEASFRPFKTDAAGHFSLDRVFPGICSIESSAHIQQGDLPDSDVELMYPQVISAEPGQNISIALGGTGAVITGKLALPKDLPAHWIAMNSFLTGDRPKDVPEGQTFHRGMFPAAVNLDGSFRIADVTPGEYTLTLEIRTLKDHNEIAANPFGGAGSNYNVAYRASQHVSITDKSPPTMDLGTLTPTAASAEPPDLP